VDQLPWARGHPLPITDDRSYRRPVLQTISITDDWPSRPQWRPRPACGLQPRHLIRGVNVVHLYDTIGDSGPRPSGSPGVYSWCVNPARLKRGAAPCLLQTIGPTDDWSLVARASTIRAAARRAGLSQSSEQLSPEYSLRMISAIRARSCAASGAHGTGAGSAVFADNAVRGRFSTKSSGVGQGRQVGGRAPPRYLAHHAIGRPGFTAFRQSDCRAVHG
jgi:hypothetical protein